MKISEVIMETDANIESLEKLLIEFYLNNINKFKYANYTKSFFVVFNDLIATYDKLISLAETEEMPEVEELEKIQERCKNCLELLSCSLKESLENGKVLYHMNKLEEFRISWENTYQPKIAKIGKILDKHPNNHHYESLYRYALSIFEEQYCVIDKIYSKAYNSLEKISPLYSIFRGTEYSSFSTFISANTIKATYQINFEDQYLTSAISSKEPSEVDYYIDPFILFHKNGDKVETRKKVIDLYKFNHGAKITSLAMTPLSLLGGIGGFLTYSGVSTTENFSWVYALLILGGSLLSAFVFKMSEIRLKSVEQYYLGCINDDYYLKKLLLNKKKK